MVAPLFGSFGCPCGVGYAQIIGGFGRGGIRFGQVGVFGIVGVRAAGHFGRSCTQSGIAEAFGSNFGSVVADNGVVAKELKEFTATFGGGSVFGLVGELFEQHGLLGQENAGPAIRDFSRSRVGIVLRPSFIFLSFRMN